MWFKWSKALRPLELFSTLISIIFVCEFKKQGYQDEDLQFLKIARIGKYVDKF